MPGTQRSSKEADEDKFEEANYVLQKGYFRQEI